MTLGEATGTTWDPHVSCWTSTRSARANAAVGIHQTKSHCIELVVVFDTSDTFRLRAEIFESAVRFVAICTTDNVILYGNFRFIFYTFYM
jgi:hypothetical protein